jgi:putative ABC transport system substrate-binding protein
MQRREALAILVGAVAALPLAGRAQQKAMPVIGVLSTGWPGPSGTPFIAAFLQGLGEAGYVEGHNLVVEYRWAEGQYDRLPALAADLVGRKVDVIVATGGSAPRAAKAASQTIPIVFTIGGDPVEAGLVSSFAQPGGHVTGVSWLGGDLTSKRLELASELVPQATAIALLVNPNSPQQTEHVVRDMSEAARAKGVQLLVLNASNESEIDAAFASLVQGKADALVVVAEPFINSRRQQIVALAARQRVPAIYGIREYVAAGGLISYGASLTAAYRQTGTYAARILKGEKPGDLPVQQATTFELVVNLKTAKALGLTVSPSVLARADEVIE